MICVVTGYANSSPHDGSFTTLSWGVLFSGFFYKKQECDMTLAEKMKNERDTSIGIFLHRKELLGKTYKYSAYLFIRGVRAYHPQQRGLNRGKYKDDLRSRLARLTQLPYLAHAAPLPGPRSRLHYFVMLSERKSLDTSLVLYRFFAPLRTTEQRTTERKRQSGN